MFLFLSQQNSATKKNNITLYSYYIPHKENPACFDINMKIYIGYEAHITVRNKILPLFYVDMKNLIPY